MRQALGPADIVAGIGQLFGGPGYEADPCPRIRRNITRLSIDGNSRLPEEEFRRNRRLCGGG